MARLSLRNAKLVSLLPTVRVESGDVVIEDGLIVAVGPDAAKGDEAAIDARGAMVLPGLANGHHHIYSALAAGMPAPPKTPTNFVEILEQVWWRLDRALDAESVRMSGLVGGLEAARSGCTAVIDHHASPNFIDGSLSVLGEALDEIGLFGVLCYEATDRGTPEQTAAGIAENRRFALDPGSPRMRGMVGGHASFTLSDETLDSLGKVRAEAKAGFHIHVAEDGADLNDGDPVARFEKAGLVGPDMLVAHGVHLDEDALGRLAEAGATIAHNARSNMNNAVGYAHRVAGFPRIAVGTDGIGCDVLSEVRVAFLKAQEAGVADSYGLPIRLLQGALTLAETHRGVPMGRFEVGAAGDVVLTDYFGHTPLTTDNFVGHLIFGFDRSNIQAVWAAGERIWPARVDVHAVMAEAREAAEALWQRMSAL